MERFLYLCENSLEGIFSGIYKAYEDRHSHEENEIRIYTPSFNRELFCRYISVETDYDRACKVARTVQRDISTEAYGFLQKTASSFRPEKADAIYRFVIEGLRVGKRVLNHLTAPFMQTLISIDRHVENEIHHFKEFLRFQELENGALFGRINPRNAILPFLADHFQDRFSMEDWMIADTVHRTVLIHRKNQECICASMEEVEFDDLDLVFSEEEESMQKLWKLFVDTIAIQQRVNPKLQRQLLPLRFRKYMNEFHEGQEVSDKSMF